jgi:hypothetical protein
MENKPELDDYEDLLPPEDNLDEQNNNGEAKK